MIKDDNTTLFDSMKIEEVVEKRQYLDSELYITALVGVIEPRDASKSLTFLSSQLPLDIYGVSCSYYTFD
jgi:hypothetical protein